MPKRKEKSVMKWYWTPSGWLRIIVVVGLLIGAAFAEGTLSTVLLVAGLTMLVCSYLATAVNIKRKRNE